MRAGLVQPGQGKADGHLMSQLMVVIIEETKSDSKDCMGKREDAMGSSCNIGNLFRNKRSCFPDCFEGGQALQQVPTRVEESSCLQIFKTGLDESLGN